MSYEAEQFRLTVIAGADLSGNQFQVVNVAGTLASGAGGSGGHTAIGVLLNKPRSGEQGTVGYFGRMKGIAGAAVNAGVSVMVASGGFLITATSGYPGVGKSLLAAASGDSFPFAGNFLNATIVA